jgi:hypothetical protein
MDRATAMAAHGRRLGHDQGKRLVEAHGPIEGRLALKLAIGIEEGSPPRDAWCAGYIEGLRDALREFDGRRNLRRLDQ